MHLPTAIISRLKHQHKAINGIIAPFGKERINYAPAPGKWSIHDNITHLAKYQPLFILRVNKMLNEDKPVFERYSAESDPEFEIWRAWDTHTLLEYIANDREKLVELGSNLSMHQLKRIGVHKKFGNLSIEMWMEFFLLHEAHHIYTMFQLANNVDIKTS